MNSMYEKVKRVMDVCLSFVCLVAFTPGFIVIAAIICMETPGSPIYVQKRVGLNGKTFYMYKLCDIKENKSCQKNAQDIEALLCESSMKEVFRNVRIAEKIEDIL